MYCSITAVSLSLVVRCKTRKFLPEKSFSVFPIHRPDHGAGRGFVTLMDDAPKLGYNIVIEQEYCEAARHAVICNMQIKQKKFV